MKELFAFFFIVIGLIQFGLLLTAFPNFNKPNDLIPSYYWVYSLVCNIFAMFMFGVVVLISTPENYQVFLMTMAHGLFLVAAIFQGFFCRELSKKIDKKAVVFSVFFILIFSVIFFIAPLENTFQQRTLLVSLFCVFLFFWQLREIAGVKRENKSSQINFLFYSTFAELLLAVIRTYFSLEVKSLSFIGHENLFLLPFIVLMMQLVFNILSYIAIAGYWLEVTVFSRVVEIKENQKITELLQEKQQMLDERNVLISNLIKTRKVAETGALSASLVHEINQPLGAMRINSKVLQKLLKKSSDELPLSVVDNIIYDNKKIEEIISALRGVFQQDRNDLQLVDLDELVSSMMPIFEPVAKQKGILLSHNLNARCSVIIKPNEFRQVLLNLFNNAVDAINANVEKVIDIQSQVNGQWVNIVISDNGQGVVPVLRDSMFDLLATSKKNGFGIGLWLSKYIVERCNGKIYYHPSNMGGASFFIDLPVADTH